MVKLSHLDSRGRARMVDVGHKPVTVRRAVASALVILERQTLEHVWNGGLEKGDALAVARVAGIQGAKQTSALIPLCHPLPLDQVAIELRLLPEKSAIRVFAEARTRAATGVEMEALTGAAVAGLALIDMVKGVDRNAYVAEIRLEIKEGGSSGRWVRDGYEDPFSRGDKANAGGDKADAGKVRNERSMGPKGERTRSRNEPSGHPGHEEGARDGKRSTHRSERRSERPPRHRGQRHER
jgi:cyclic pyranopterin monophosphate synthase